jgi:hypothetical protein
MKNLFKHFPNGTNDPVLPVRVIGVYKIKPTMESIIEAAKYHNYDWLLDERGGYNEEIDWDNIKNLTLVELQIIGSFHTSDLMEIMQNDQAPYMEYFLDLAGFHSISKELAEETDNRRVCFFMHFTDNKQPLLVKGKSYKLPSITPLPDRLIPFTHYLPVD